MAWIWILLPSVSSGQPEFVNCSGQLNWPTELLNLQCLYYYSKLSKRIIWNENVINKSSLSWNNCFRFSFDCRLKRRIKKLNWKIRLEYFIADNKIRIHGDKYINTIMHVTIISHSHDHKWIEVWKFTESEIQFENIVCTQKSLWARNCFRCMTGKRKK